jgi:DNA polymerase I-like protein with 3'-5' exonuclease and polymerase domains
VSPTTRGQRQEQPPQAHEILKQPNGGRQSPSSHTPGPQRHARFLHLARRYIISATTKAEGPRLIFDTEADGLLDAASKMHCIVVADLDGDRIDEFGPTQIEAGLARLSEARYLVGHNISGYDLPLLRKLYGWSPVLDCVVVDTLIASRLILPLILDLDRQAIGAGDSSMGKLTGRHSLEAWGARLGMPKVGTDIEVFSEWTPELQQRCVRDVQLTKALWQFLQPDGQAAEALTLEQSTAVICEGISSNGLPFDVEAAKPLQQQWVEQHHALKAPLTAQFPEIQNLNSRQQVVAFLLKHGWVPEKRTKTGRPSLDDEALEALPTIFPKLASLADYYVLSRRIAQLATGDEAWLKHVGSDGRIHGAIVHIGTPHSRAAHFGPNIAQIPNPKKGKPLAAECRGLFRTRDDWMFVTCDQDGIQDRAFAHHLAAFDGGAYAKAFINGLDTHWDTARALTFVSQPTVRDKGNKLHVALREGAKSFRYGFLFGMGAEKAGSLIYRTIKAAEAVDPTCELMRRFFGAGTPNTAVLEQVGKEALRKFRAATSGLSRLRKHLETQAQSGWLLGLDGRRVPVPVPYKALNYAVTSAEAVICKRWLVNVHDELHTRFRYGWDGDVVIVAWVHDELVCCCRPEIADQIGEIMVRHAKEAGEHYKFKVPLDASYSIGRSWAGEASTSKPDPTTTTTALPPGNNVGDARARPTSSTTSDKPKLNGGGSESTTIHDTDAEPEPRRKPGTYQIIFAEASLPAALIPLTTQPRWVCCGWEWRNNKWTKPPIQPGSGFPAYARNNDQSTWGTYAEAVKRVIDGGADGIGFCLLGSDVAAVDLDHCCSLAPRAIADWARDLVSRAPENTYCEVTVSGTGLRLIGLGTSYELHRKFPASDGKGSFELYRKAARYITVSGKVLDGATGPLPNIDDLLNELLGEASHRTAQQQAPKPTGKWARGGMTEWLYELIANGVAEPKRSSQFFAAVAHLKRLGWSIDGIVWLLEKHPDGIASKYAGRLTKEVERAFDKIVPDGACLGDFYAYMPQHQFFYAPARRLWPAASIDARMPKMALLDHEGKLVLEDDEEDSEPVLILASKWLDQNRPIEEMTWAPGEPMLLHDRLMVESGWIHKPGATTFNLYQPPIIQGGDPRKVLPWVRLVFKVFRKDARHTIGWFAHRVQRPQEKINHGLVTGGKPGIGKDTILAPIRQAVGEWNFQDVTPKDMFETYSPYNRAVILRVNEMRDLGEMSQYSFYSHMKQYLASPPETLLTKEKYIKHYYLPNVCGVVFTLNDKETGMYLPPDDRRHYVAWSDRRQEEFPVEFWQKIWDWYDDGGFAHVAAYLRQYDLSKFRPKAPPLKTSAFWDIASANRATEETALQDALDFLERPAAVTIEQVLTYPNHELGEWFRDRKNRRVFPKHFRECGYVVVHNPDRDTGLWVINGQRQTVYAREELSPRDRLDAARQLTKEEKCDPPPPA